MQTANMQGEAHTTADKALDDRFERVNIAEDRLLVQEEQRNKNTALACCMSTTEHSIVLQQWANLGEEGVGAALGGLVLEAGGQRD